MAYLEEEQQRGISVGEYIEPDEDMHDVMEQCPLMCHEQSGVLHQNGNFD